jgi:membrane protease YdiL (CAAX protease family)
MEIENIIIDNKKPLLKGWIRALLIIIPYFISAIVIELIGYLLLGLNPDDKSLTVIQETVIQICGTGGVLLVVFIFTRYLDRVNIKSLGFQLKGYGNHIFQGIVVGAVMMLLGFVILLILNEISVTSVEFDIYKLLAGIVLFSFVALGEELLMRGYILNNLLQSMNKYIALVLSSLIFSTLHMLNPNLDLMSFISILLSGLLLGIAYIYTKNLWFPIALHFSWNFFQGTVFGFNVSGVSTYSVISQHPVGNNMLNGGEFGFEGSILSLIFIAVTTLLIWWSARKNAKQ